MHLFAHTAVFLYGEFSHTQKLRKSLVIKKGQKVEVGDELTLPSSCQTTVNLLHGLQLIFSQKIPIILLPWSDVIGNLVFA